MRFPRSPFLLPVLLALLPAAVAAAPHRAHILTRPLPAPPTYEERVLPLFRARCAGCHGGSQPRAGLDLRTRGDLLEGGFSGPPVVPGNPEASLLYRLLREGKMPVGGARFSPAELAVVAGWIRSGARGAPGGGHWAFRTPARPAVPAVRASPRVRNPVDAFVLAELERRGLTFSPEADRRTLLRRVSFDLTGLPPTPEETADFLADARPDAYERVVDRLLASPRFGERWARHWLDVAGYADSEGVLQEDRLRPNAWRYRDAVIRAFNADVPYDRFVREQLAGDELVEYRTAEQFPPALIDTLAATGFLRTAVDATRDDFNAHQYGEYQYRMLHDTQTIVGSALLGLQLQCARCHGHKYEPLSQHDYYRVQALFMGAVRPRGAVLPTYRRQIVAASPAEQARAREVNAAVDRALAEVARDEASLLAEHRRRYLEAHLEQVPAADRPALRSAALLPEGERTPEQRALVARYASVAEAPVSTLLAASAPFREAHGTLERRRAAEQARRVTLPEIRAFYDLDADPPPTPFLERGDWLRPGAPVPPGVPRVLAAAAGPLSLAPPAPGAATTGRRRAFAEWLTRPEHPLTARVAVNRLWSHYFGAGIVATTDNFGRSGAPPTHPALLDWLATELTRGPGGAPPWTLKGLHRLLVTSSTYRQASTYRAAAARVDPENRLLWRMRPRRLEAEAVRDAVLAAAGTLDGRLFGEPTPLETRPDGEIVPVGEEAGGRRSLYLLVRRTTPVTLLNVFDAPVMETNCTRRITSTTASQALALLNSRFIAAQARHLARRVLREAPPSGSPATPLHPAAITRACELTLGRPPTPTERAAALDFLREQLAHYAGPTPGATALESAVEPAWADFCQALLASNEFVYLD